nr:MAG TPA: hypothetical protein [Caudoviricetes sp.]
MQFYFAYLILVTNINHVRYFYVVVYKLNYNVVFYLVYILLHY